MDKEAVCVTKQEKMRLKDQLLAFVERVSVPYPHGGVDRRMPEEVEALPAIVQMLLKRF